MRFPAGGEVPEDYLFDSDPGENERLVDPIWPLWNVLDYTLAGRGDWYPKLSY